MPVTPTYPGVYIEEIPSGVRTIVGVATSIGAFVDYFPQGPMNEAVEIFSYADFERIFGGLDTNSEASYAIQQFFLNGGTTAYVVRTTSGTSTNAATSAAIVVQDGATNNILLVTAANPGQWGNQVRVDIDYGTTDPSTLFNLTVTEVSFAGGTTTVVATETFRNLTLDSAETDYVVEVVNARSQLVTVQSLGTNGRPAQSGTTSSAFSVLQLPEWQANTAVVRGHVIVDANGNLQEVTTAGITGPGPGEPTWSTTLNATTQDPNAAGVTWTMVATGAGVWLASHAFSVGDRILDPNGNTQVVTVAGTSTIPPALPPNWSKVVGTNTTDNTVTWKLIPTGTGMLFPAWSAQEVFPVGAEIVDSNGNLQRVTASGTSGGTPPGWSTTIGNTTPDGGVGGVTWTLVSPTRLTVDLAATMSVTLNGNPAFSTLVQLNAAGPPPAITVGWLVATLESQIRAVDPSLSNATVTLVGSASTEAFLQIKAGTMNPSDTLTLTDVTGTLAADLGLTTNVQQYALGSSTAAGAQALPGGVASPGSNGTWNPTTDAAGVAQGLIGDQLLKTGMYALLDADLFNILCIPVTALLPDTDAAQVAANATSLCTSRRAFYILDPPQEDGDRDTVDGIKNWLDQNGSLRSRNSAVYFPRVDIADALNKFRLRTTATSGTMAGIYARIDVARGVWKAPAGIEASLGGVQSLEYKLTDGENGVLNPLGINCLRTFPVYGPVSWGARTLYGADQLVDDYKYVPVRRFALFLEESLYRGTKWVVFEPNDEPLWSQIRLNIGAFMQSLFRQGAFQGTTPRDAYLVKCDNQTTTQTDINNGIVNILVGFAPLKPAEFVILKIQQLAGQIPT